jgi:flagellar basal-body rod protein FlgG
VQPNISIPQDAVDVTISKSGQVQVITAGTTEPSVVGQLELASFFNEAGWKRSATTC